MMRKALIIGDPQLNRSVARWCQQVDIQAECLDSAEVEKVSSLSSYDLIFETVTGTTAEKRSIIRRLDELVGTRSEEAQTEAQTQTDTQTDLQVPILTSFLHHSATEISSWSTVPERFIGFHPLHFDEMHTMELAPSLTSDHTLVQRAIALLEEKGKHVELIEDTVAGVLPRTLALIINEAAHALSDQIASVEDIDIAMKKGTNYPLGPLEWADRLGIHTILLILEGLHRDFGDDRYRPAPLLRKKVWAKQLGISTGQGFYTYDH